MRIRRPRFATLECPAELVAFRVHGRPRDAADGTHRQVVVFAAPDISPARLAGLLRDAADRLAPRDNFGATSPADVRRVLEIIQAGIRAELDAAKPTPVPERAGTAHLCGRSSRESS